MTPVEWEGPDGSLLERVAAEGGEPMTRQEHLLTITAEDANKAARDERT
jgi:hypothetical protein